LGIDIVAQQRHAADPLALAPGRSDFVAEFVRRLKLSGGIFFLDPRLLNVAPATLRLDAEHVVGSWERGIAREVFAPLISAVRAGRLQFYGHPGTLASPPQKIPPYAVACMSVWDFRQSRLGGDQPVGVPFGGFVGVRVVLADGPSPSLDERLLAQPDRIPESSLQNAINACGIKTDSVRFPIAMYLAQRGIKSGQYSLSELAIQTAGPEARGERTGPQRVKRVFCALGDNLERLHAALARQKPPPIAKGG